MASDQKENTSPLQISFEPKDRDWTKGWKLYYWQFGGGRGQYVRLMLEFCGVEWTEELKKYTFEYGGDKEKESWKAQLAALDKLKQSGMNRTSFAPPILTHNDDFVISQLGAIMLFLADLFPKLKPSNPMKMARARQMLFQVADALEEGHTASHPIKAHESYNIQKEAANKELKIFCAKGGRLSKHLEVLSAELNRNNKGKGWFYEDKLTFVDIYVATFMRAFDESMKILKCEDLYTDIDEYAPLREHRKRFEATETYQKFAKSDKMPKIDTTPSFQT